MMESLWKAGEVAAQEVSTTLFFGHFSILSFRLDKLPVTYFILIGKMLEHFMNSPLKSKEPKQATLEKGSTKLSTKEKTSTIVDQYSTLRNRPDLPGTSRLSAYLAAGVISVRACLRASLGMKEGEKTTKKLQVDKRELGIGMWQSELGWRDFYQHVRSSLPQYRALAFKNSLYSTPFFFKLLGFLSCRSLLLGLE